MCFFFFQAEDGIRDIGVTGVQTCALPIFDGGISPRAIPGHEKAVYITTGDEHTAQGHNTEEADDRNEQMVKRMRKLERAAQEMRLPAWYGPEDAELTLVGWGSTYGALREATDRLNAEGHRTNFLQFVDIF